jgi:hypothetical protein
MLHIFSSVLRGMLQVFIQNISSVSEIYCSKCFIWMLHMFHTYVASVLSECCIYFTHMLRVFYLDVAYVSHICCNIMFQMFICVRRILHLSVSCVQVFHGDTVSDGRMTRASGDGDTMRGG